MERDEVLDLLRQNLDERGEVKFKNGVVLDRWHAGGAVGVFNPTTGHRQTFGPRELAEAYDLALGIAVPR